MLISGVVFVGATTAFLFYASQNVGNKNISNDNNASQVAENPLPITKYSCIISSPTKPYDGTSKTDGQVFLIESTNKTCPITIMGCANDLCSEGKVFLECGIEVTLCGDDVICSCK